MNVQQPLLRILLIAPLLAIATGCTTPRQVAFSVGYMMNKPEADYDAIDKTRTENRLQSATAFTSETPYWTAYRGPKTDGHYLEQPLTLEWSGAGPKEVWRLPVGAGFGSFVVAEGLAFTLEQRRDKEALAAYDLATGKPVWQHEYTARFYEAMSGEGPRSTPCYHDGKVYSYGAMGDLHCVWATTGKPVWQINPLKEIDAKNISYGLSSSPIVVGQTVVILAGESEDGQTVRAYDLDSGKLVWSALQDKAGYSTPQRMKLAGRDQLVICMGDRTVGLNPTNGELLWEFPWAVMQGLASSQPVQVDDNRFAVSGGYGKGTTLVQINKSGNRFSAEQVWESRRLNANFSTPMYHDDFLYGLDGGILVCLDLETGKRVWKDGRFGFGQMLKVDNSLLISGEKGEVIVVDADPEKLSVRGRFKALEDKTLNPPAIAHGFLLLRNSREMVCYDLRH
jgi:outer membrane protein assembly factor BamB